MLLSHFFRYGPRRIQYIGLPIRGTKVLGVQKSSTTMVCEYLKSVRCDNPNLAKIKARRLAAGQFFEDQAAAKNGE